VNNSFPNTGEYGLEQEHRVVMLPLLLENAEIPDFIEDRKYVDLREHYFTGLMQIAALVHGLSEFRMNSAIRRHPPQSVGDIWDLLESVGFAPFVVFGRDDFEEILKHGGELIRKDYASFVPSQLLASVQVSDHVKSLLHQIFPRRWYKSLLGETGNATRAAQR
jgi:hypothetical protein